MHIFARKMCKHVTYAYGSIGFFAGVRTMNFCTTVSIIPLCTDMMQAIEEAVGRMMPPMETFFGM